jgi:VanZ family protein
MTTLPLPTRLLRAIPTTPRLLRCLIAISYTLILTITLIQPSRTPLIGPAAPPGPPDATREAILTFMHLIGFALLMSSLWWAFESLTTPQRALWITLAFALILSPLSELLQTLVPGRGASWGDWVTNTMSTLVSGLLIWQRYIRPSGRRRLESEHT